MFLTCTVPTRTAGGGIGGGPPEVADFPGPPHEVTAQRKPQTSNEWEAFLFSIISLMRRGRRVRGPRRPGIQFELSGLGEAPHRLERSRSFGRVQWFQEGSAGTNSLFEKRLLALQSVAAQGNENQTAVFAGFPTADYPLFHKTVHRMGGCGQSDTQRCGKFAHCPTWLAPEDIQRSLFVKRDFKAALAWRSGHKKVRQGVEAIVQFECVLGEAGWRGVHESFDRRLSMSNGSMYRTIVSCQLNLYSANGPRPLKFWGWQITTFSRDLTRCWRFRRVNIFIGSVADDGRPDESYSESVQGQTQLPRTGGVRGRSPSGVRANKGCVGGKAVGDRGGKGPEAVKVGG